ncbi:MAG: hypothetical protein FWG22_01515, partial [Prolixibacteraceae bacterium]|nr:hypothetical protein [Prolixibacteraceae bacterium]
ETVNLDVRIEELFDFIDGNVISAGSAHYDDDRERDDDGDIDITLRYSFFVKTGRITTDKGETYTLKFFSDLMRNSQRIGNSYNYTMDEQDEGLGISELRVIRESDKAEFVIGDFRAVNPKAIIHTFRYNQETLDKMKEEPGE